MCHQDAQNYAVAKIGLSSNRKTSQATGLFESTNKSNQPSRLSSGGLFGKK
jgi:hypothetical protein